MEKETGHIGRGWGGGSKILHTTQISLKKNHVCLNRVLIILDATNLPNHHKTLYTIQSNLIHITSANSPLPLSLSQIHCVKSARIRSFSCPYFPAFRLNMGRDTPYLFVWIQSKCGKIRTRKTPNTDTFYPVLLPIFY